MKKIWWVFFLSVLVTGCASRPPMPPEPKGPLVKVNVSQPHEKYEGNENDK